MSKQSDAELGAAYGSGEGVRGKYAARYRQGPVRIAERPLTVFIGHDRGDGPAAQAVAARLGEHGVRVWLGEADDAAGTSLRDQLAPVIDDVHYVAVLLSHRSATAAWMESGLREIVETQLPAHRLPVFTILLEPAEIPFFLRDRGSADFTTPERLARSLPRLLVAIGAVDDEREVETARARRSA